MIDDAVSQSDRQAELCKMYKSLLPNTAKIFVNIPMPPLPQKPEPKFIPNNWPIPPEVLNRPPSPDDAVNPYNPLSSRQRPFDPLDPQSGSGVYMHKPNKVNTPYIKPALNYGPVYQGGLDMNAEPKVLVS